MNCSTCEVECVRFGKHRNGLRRFRCPRCGKTFTEPHKRPLDGMTVPMDQAVLALQLLVEGASIRSTERITGLHRDTILRLLVLAGQRCERLMADRVRNVPVKDVQCDEIWGYVQKKESHKLPSEASDESIGDAYCFVAIERHTKLVLNFTLGRRSQATTNAFIEGVREATTAQPFQISTDGFNPYIAAIDNTLSDRVDYGMLVKVYAAPREGQQRYSPADVVEAVPRAVLGNPDKRRICTSHVERQNLTMRMQIRRLTRLTNAFSKKWENLWAALCLHFAHYNFCRIHSTIRVTPAMESGLTDHVWTIAELLA
jgi:transposase-like protein/IS1 family transposase